MYPFALDTLRDILLSSKSFPPSSLESYIQSFPLETQSSASAFLAHIEHLTASDSKAAPLKTLQGFLWKTGFETGRLKAPLYADVPVALHTWKKDGKSLAIFSSGSVAAQRLFLKFTGIEGESTSESIDLLDLFAGHFDTVNAGSKSERDSYVKIAEALNVKPESVLFLSDNVKEIRAAHAARMKAFVVDRPGNASLTQEDRAELTVITDFKEIKFD